MDHLGFFFTQSKPCGMSFGSFLLGECPTGLFIQGHTNVSFTSSHVVVGFSPRWLRGATGPGCTAGSAAKRS
jgi:hypothetical protein